MPLPPRAVDEYPSDLLYGSDQALRRAGAGYLSYRHRREGLRCNKAERGGSASAGPELWVDHRTKQDMAINSRAPVTDGSGSSLKIAPDQRAPSPGAMTPTAGSLAAARPSWTARRRQYAAHRTQGDCVV